jgi:hypothetical protein
MKLLQLGQISLDGSKLKANASKHKRNSKIRIDPLIEESDVLNERIAPARSRDSGNTILAKEFRGGVLVMTGANSAVGLRSMPVRYLFLDEVDGYPPDVEGEGDAISLAEARTRTFARRKIFIVSTPTLAGARPSNGNMKHLISAVSSCRARIASIINGCGLSSYAGTKANPTRWLTTARRAKPPSSSITKPGCWSRASGAPR